MSSSHPARPSARRARALLLVALTTAVAGVGIGLVGILGDPLSAASAGATRSQAPSQTSTATAHEGEPGAPPLPESGVTAADGAVDEGTTIFDDGLPAVAHLESDLRDALRRAAADAGADGVTFSVNSGWRSPQYQERLLSDAVAQYGSAEEAARWVATPTTSPHVRGEAIDMGQDASAWLSANGAAYGLCQIYANEPWHYELRRDAIDGGCPAMYPDPTFDPRMR